MKSRMIFIVGVGRSGTSLLQSMLNAHSRIGFAPETAFIRRYLSGNRLNRMRQEHTFETLANALANDSYLQRLHLDASAIIKVLDRTDPGDRGEFFQGLIQEHLGTGEFIWVGDKDPRLIEYLPMLRRLWPESRVVHIMRDPRDVLASKKKKRSGQNIDQLPFMFSPTRFSSPWEGESGRKYSGRTITSSIMSL